MTVTDQRSSSAAVSTDAEPVALPPPSARSHRTAAVIEIAVFFALSLAIDMLWGSGHRFWHIAPHPFWAIVLLMTVQYGTTEGLLATAAASAILLVGNLPPQSFDQDVHQYALDVLWRPLLWMVAAVVLGELRGRHRAELTDTSERLRNAERQVSLLADNHRELSAVRDRLATRLAGQLQTAAGVLEAARPLETLDPGRVLEGAGDLLRTALQAKSYSLYLLRGDALVLVAAEGWNDQKAYPDRYASTSVLFQDVVAARRFVSVATPDGERALGGTGLMAGPLASAAGELFGMLKIEDVRFGDFNLGSLHTLKAVCEWIAVAYANALSHQDSQLEDTATHLYSLSYLQRQSGYLTDVARRFGFDLTLLTFRVNEDDLSEDTRAMLPATLGQVSREMLRGTDLMFSHQPLGTEFSVLLPGTTTDNALIVVRKLVEAVTTALGHQVTCDTRVRALWVADADGRVGGMRASDHHEALVA